MAITDFFGLSEVRLNGESQPGLRVDSQGFDIRVRFSPRPMKNPIRISAVDTSGNQSELEFFILFDQESPTILFSRGKYYNNLPVFHIKGEIRDNYWLKSANHLDVTGKQSSFEFAIHKEESGTFELLAKDFLDNEALGKVEYIYDTIPPTISLGDYPAYPESILNTSVQHLALDMVLKDNEALDWVRAGSVGQNLNELKEYRWAARIPLEKGLNTIPIAIRDMAGNQALKIIHVYRNKPPFPPEFLEIPEMIEYREPYTFRWVCEDPEGQAISYRVYVGLHSSPPLHSAVAEPYFKVEGLENGRKYFLRVEAEDTHGGIQSSRTVSFMTSNNPPYFLEPPKLEEKEDHYLLTWKAEDEDGDALRYRIWLGETEQDFRLAHQSDRKQAQVTDLKHHTTYRIMIEADDGKGGTARSEVLVLRTPPAPIILDFLLEGAETFSPELKQGGRIENFKGREIELVIHGRSKVLQVQDGVFFIQEQLNPGVNLLTIHTVTAAGKTAHIYRVTLKGPEVHILHPVDGQVFEDSRNRVKGTVSHWGNDPVTLYLNNISRIIPTTNGTFDYELILESGRNHIRVEAVSGAGSDSDEASVLLDLPIEYEDAIWIELTWNQNLTDIDLYVIEPNGQAVWYSNKKRLGELDRDDTDGFGPEHYTLRRDRAVSGDYRVRVHYYGRSGNPNPVECKVVAKVDGMLLFEKVFVLTHPSSSNDHPLAHGPDWKDVGTIHYTVGEWVVLRSQDIRAGTVRVDENVFSGEDRVKVPSGTIVNLEAKANSGYSFKGWFVDGRSIGTSNPLAYTVRENALIVAQFEKDEEPQRMWYW